VQAARSALRSAAVPVVRNAAVLFLALCACSDAGSTGGQTDTDAAVSEPTGDASAQTPDAALQDTGTDGEADPGNQCSVDGNPGECMLVAACGALAKHTSYPGYCPGTASVECCAKTPNVADNPPIPAGYKLMQQASVTPAMTTWAVAILHDPTTYPIFSTATKVFGTLTVLARVEWHPPDFQNSVVHRGVTLYQPG
jgi:hypothetical protein